MTNQFVNPLINYDSYETLTDCADCLEFMSESVTALVFSETSGNAQQGLQALLDCIKDRCSR